MPSDGTKKRSGFDFRRAVAVLIVLSALMSASCNSGDNGLGIRLDLKSKKLSNGLTVILVEDHTVPIISYQTWYRVGSADEKPGRTGLAHLFEHLMFKGTAKYGAKEFFLQLEAKGAEVNAFTTRDYTVYYESFVPTLLEKVIDMESDRMTQLKLDEEVLNTEREVVMEERRLRTDNTPEGKMQEAIWELAYRVHPYQWPVIGYPRDLMATTVDDLKAFYGTYYRPSNATIVIVGDFNSDRAMELIKKYYGGLEDRPRPARKLPAEPEQMEERRLVLRDQVASEKFVHAYHVTSATDEDSYALDVLSNILFAGTSSRAYRLLVEEKELALGVAGTAFTPTYPGLFLINGTLRQGVSAEKAEALLSQLVKEVQENGVTQDEINVAVRQLTVQMVDSVRTPKGLGTLIGTVQTVFGDPRRFAEDLSKYTKVTAADVKRVANKYLIPNNRSVITLVPTAAKEGKK